MDSLDSWRGGRTALIFLFDESDAFCCFLYGLVIMKDEEREEKERKMMLKRCLKNKKEALRGSTIEVIFSHDVRDEKVKKNEL